MEQVTRVEPEGWRLYKYKYVPETAGDQPMSAGNVLCQCHLICSKGCELLAHF